MTKDSKSASYYDKHVAEISQQYLSLDFEDVHSSWLHLLPTLLNKPSLAVLDVGAGTERDISYLYSHAVSCLGNAKKFGKFIAAEPSQNLRSIGREFTNQQSISWIDDSLPELKKTQNQKVSFDLILLSAVWMHIPFSRRACALENLFSLLKHDGFIVMSLKHGMTEEEQQKRSMFAVSASEVKEQCSQIGLTCEIIAQTSPDALNRKDVCWETLVLRKSESG
jgi:SAM-dependent methyltransferase